MPPLTLDDAVARADDLLQSVIADYPKHLETTFAEMKRSARSGSGWTSGSPPMT